MIYSNFISNKRCDRILTNIPDFVFLEYYNKYNEIYADNYSDKKTALLFLVKDNLGRLTSIQRDTITLLLDGYTQKSIAYLRGTRHSAVQENIRLAVLHLRQIFNPKIAKCKNCGRAFTVNQKVKKHYHCSRVCRRAYYYRAIGAEMELQRRRKNNLTKLQL